MIFDSHAHYDNADYDTDRDETIRSIFSNQVEAIVNCSCDFESSKKSLRLAEQYENIYAAIGVYPHETHKCGQFDKEKLKALASHDKVVAIGEIGLDYYYDDAPRPVQKYWCEQQILLANEMNLPILFHDRVAHADTLEILKRLKPKGVVHCFSGSVQMEREIVALGMMIGIGGVVTFKNAKTAVEVAADLPIDHLLLETDAPYMTPEPFRGKRNRSDYIRYVAEKIADIKGLTPETVIEKTTQNARRLFGIG